MLHDIIKAFLAEHLADAQYLKKECVFCFLNADCLVVMATKYKKDYFTQGNCC